MRLKTRGAVDWKAACTLFSRGSQETEDKTTQATEAYIEREERLELRNDKDTEKFVTKID